MISRTFESIQSEALELFESDLSCGRIIVEGEDRPLVLLLMLLGFDGCWCLCSATQHFVGGYPSHVGPLLCAFQEISESLNSNWHSDRDAKMMLSGGYIVFTHVSKLFTYTIYHCCRANVIERSFFFFFWGIEGDKKGNLERERKETTRKEGWWVEAMSTQRMNDREVPHRSNIYGEGEKAKAEPFCLWCNNQLCWGCLAWTSDELVG